MRNINSGVYGFTFADELRTVLEAVSVILIILKLNNLIDWSWWWVLSPISIPFVLACITVISIMIYNNIKKNNSKNK